MALTREQVATALLARLNSANYFGANIGRRAVNPASIGPDLSPALFLVIRGESFKRPSPTLPAVRTLHFTGFVYNDVGADQNAVPETGLNNAIEAIEAALAPDDASSNRCTLGQLVFAVLINGQELRAPAELTGKAMAVVPIDVILP